jgi:hypothetical protein
MSGYRKFTLRSNAAPQKTLASLATLAEPFPVSGLYQDTDRARHEPPKTQSGPAKPAKVAKVGVQCNANAEPSLAYRAVSAEPSGAGCTVEIVELPAAGRYRKTFAFLQLRPPALVPVERWRQCVKDGSKFLAVWGEQAESLGWTTADLFGLHTLPAKPHPSYNRLSRYDCTGLCWLLGGRPVVALTEATASIRNPATGSITTYRRFNKPALGPLGDTLDDLQ